MELRSLGARASGISMFGWGMKKDVVQGFVFGFGTTCVREVEPTFSMPQERMFTRSAFESSLCSPKTCRAGQKLQVIACPLTWLRSFAGRTGICISRPCLSIYGLSVCLSTCKTPKPGVNSPPRRWQPQAPKSLTPTRVRRK